MQFARPAIPLASCHWFVWLHSTLWHALVGGAQKVGDPTHSCIAHLIKDLLGLLDGLKSDKPVFGQETREMDEVEHSPTQGTTLVCMYLHLSSNTVAHAMSTASL